MRWKGEGPRYRKNGANVAYHCDDVMRWSEASAVDNA